MNLVGSEARLDVSDRRDELWRHAIERRGLEARAQLGRTLVRLDRLDFIVCDARGERRDDSYISPKFPHHGRLLSEKRAAATAQFQVATAIDLGARRHACKLEIATVGSIITGSYLHLPCYHRRR